MGPDSWAVMSSNKHYNNVIITAIKYNFLLFLYVLFDFSLRRLSFTIFFNDESYLYFPNRLPPCSVRPQNVKATVIQEAIRMPKHSPAPRRFCRGWKQERAYGGRSRQQ